MPASLESGLTCFEFTGAEHSAFKPFRLFLPTETGEYPTETHVEQNCQHVIILDTNCSLYLKILMEWQGHSFFFFFCLIHILSLWLTFMSHIIKAVVYSMKSADAFWGVHMYSVSLSLGVEKEEQVSYILYCFRKTDSSFKLWKIVWESGMLFKQRVSFW